MTRFPILCFIMVLLSIVGLCVAQGSLGLLLVAGALAAISWYVTEGPRGRSLPRWVSNVLVIGITLNALVELSQPGSDILRSLSSFALWLTLIKLYERRTPRDHAQLMSLSFLLVLIASLQSSELLFGLILLSYAIIGLYVLVLYQLYAAHETVKQERVASIPEGARLLPSTKPIIGRHPALHFRALVVGVGIGGFLLSVVAFLSFPRGLVEAAFGDAGRAMSRSVTGYVDEIDLMHGHRITESRREVMTVQIRDQNGRPMRSSTPLLLKGSVLDRYEGRGQWTRSDRPRRSSHIDRDHFRPIPPRRRDDSSRFTMHVDVHNDVRTIFTVHRPVALKIDQPQQVKFDPLSGVMELDPDGPSIRSYQLQYDHGRLTYFGSRLRRHPDRPHHSDRLAALKDERIERLAQEILANEGIPPHPIDDEESEAYWNWTNLATQAFARFLQSPAFTYDTDLTHIVYETRDGEMEDPIAHFLLNHRRGHCEYFAAALMALCYNVGIESRLVTGYVAVAYDEANQYYKVLELNAHAWVEARTSVDAWRTIDPTPTQVFRDLHEPETTVADHLRWFYDRFDMAWNRTVVRYDSGTQTRLAAQWDLGIKELFIGAWERMKWGAAELNRMFRLGPAGYIWMGLMSIVLVLAILVLLQVMKRTAALRHLLRLRGIRGREYHRMLRQLGFYLDMLTVLDRAEIAKPNWQPPLQFAEQLMDAHPREATIVKQVAETYYRARYGHEQLKTDELRQLRNQIRDLAERLGVRP